MWVDLLAPSRDELSDLAGMLGLPGHEVGDAIWSMRNYQQELIGSNARRAPIMTPTTPNASIVPIPASTARSLTIGSSG